MIKRRIVLLVCFCNVIAAMFSQRIVNVCGSAHYVVPETQTLEDAKRTAITRARLRAMADEFGTIVSQTNAHTIHQHQDKSELSYDSYAENSVCGIWLEDTKEPELHISYSNGLIEIVVSVCGKARQMRLQQLELEWEVYNRYRQTPYEVRTNTLVEGTPSLQFNDSDRIYVTFRTPISGYVALFLRDETTDIVTTYLPYDNNDGYAREVKANTQYKFLTREDNEYPYRTETIMVTNRKIETNTIILVFSKKKFHLPLNNKGQFFYELSLKQFQKWIHNLQNDEACQIEEKTLTVKK